MSSYQIQSTDLLGDCRELGGSVSDFPFPTNPIHFLFLPAAQHPSLQSALSSGRFTIVLQCHKCLGGKSIEPLPVALWLVERVGWVSGYVLQPPFDIARKNWDAIFATHMWPT